MRFLSKIEHFLFIILIIFIPSQLAKHFWPPTSFVSGIRIDYLSPALYFNDLILFLLLGVALLKSKNKIYRLILHKYQQIIKKNIISKATLIFFLILIFVSINILVSLRKQVTIYSWLRVFQLVVLFIYLHSKSKFLKSEFLKYLPIPVIYSSLIAILQTIKQSSIGGFLYWLGERRFSLSTPGISKASVAGRVILRPYATFPHPNSLAGFVLLAIIVIYYSSVNIKTSRFNHFTYVIALIALAMSFSQSAWLMCLVWLWFTLIKKSKNNNLKHIVSFLFACFITAVLFCSEKESISQRVSIVLSSLNILNNHLFFGVGLGNFIPALFKNNRILIADMSPFLYYQPVHNIYLLIISELGLMGTFLIALLINYFLPKIKRMDNERKYALLAVLLIGIADHYWLTLYQNKLFLTLMLGLL